MDGGRDSPFGDGNWISIVVCLRDSKLGKSAIRSSVRGLQLNEYVQSHEGVMNQVMEKVLFFL